MFRQAYHLPRSQNSANAKLELYTFFNYLEIEEPCMVKVNPHVKNYIETTFRLLQ